MCALYAGIYRVALRLQKAADARRSRMTASLVSVASHTISRIGIGMSTSGPAAVPATATTSTSVPDGTGARLTAVAELHSSNAGEDQPTPTSSDYPDHGPTNDDDGRRQTSTYNEEDCDYVLTMTSCQRAVAGDRATHPAEDTPLLQEQLQSASNDLRSGGVFVASTSGTDGPQLPVSCRQRWLVVLSDDKAGGWRTRDVDVDGRRRPIVLRRSVDAGRPRACLPRRSVFELSTNTEQVAPPPALCLDQSRPNRSDDIVSASDDEIENALNDAMDVGNAEQDGNPTHSNLSQPEQPPTQSTDIERQSTSQLTTEDLHVDVDELRTDHDRETATASGLELGQRETRDDDHGDAERREESVRRMADIWMRAARSRFTANRRLAHLRHWKLQRHLMSAAAAHSSTTSSSIDDRQTLVSRRLAARFTTS